MATIEELVEAQSTSQSLIARIWINYTKLSTEKRTPTAIRSRLANLQSYWDECRARHHQICALADEETRKTHQYFVKDAFFAISDCVEQVTDSLNGALEKMQEKTKHAMPDPSDTLSEPKTVSVHLPQINLPKFSGDLTTWTNFHDLFVSLVDARKDLANSQKLHYLKASLVGNASRILAHTPVTDANYSSALEALKSRYGSTRAIVYSHLQQFMDIPKVSSNSVRELRSLRDQTCEVHSALQNLSRPVTQWEDLFIFIILSKLDKTTRHDWELTLTDVHALPTFDKLDDFLSTRIRALESSTSGLYKEAPARVAYPIKNPTVRTYLASSAAPHCFVCQGDHPLYQCQAFLGKSARQRLDLVRQDERCINCFRRGHLNRSCQSGMTCRQCKGKHHTLVHVEQNRPPGNVNNRPPFATNNEPYPSVSSSTSRGIGEISTNSSNIGINNTVLPTAVVLLRGTSGRSYQARALLDQGSQASFISESAAQLLRLETKPVSVRVSGIGATNAGPIKKIAFTTVEPCNEQGPVIPISALVMTKLSAYLPPPALLARDSAFLRSLSLADPCPFSNRPIDIIIGADYYGTMLLEGLIYGTSQHPNAQQSIFGWILSGTLHSPPTTAHDRLCVNHLTFSDPLQEAVQQFWEIEEVPQRTPRSKAEIQCENHFVSTHTRRPDGRYVVRLPFKSPPPLEIGDTAVVARRSLLSNEKRLANKPDLAAAYINFLNEYAQLAHMEPVPTPEIANPSAIYLPHHPVLKVASNTTKIRVVFNASCASSNRTSLNDHLLIGPKLQADLFSLVLRWRSHKYVYTADLEKMFRQIRVHPQDVDFQRILWRSNMNDEISPYRLLTVTYGTASAPFLANRVIKQLVIDEGTQYPLAVPVLENDTYVDDLMFGAEKKHILLETRKQLTDLLRAGGFRPYKWPSNDPSLLSDLSAEELSVDSSKLFGEDSQLKVLGVLWNPVSDCFSFQVQSFPTVVSKRTFLALLARLFDPLGWVSPVTISAKILLQTLWIRKLEWDDPLPEDLASRCQTYQAQLNSLSRIHLPRWTGQCGSVLSQELHGFCDASNSAYAAVVYLRISDSDGTVHTSLLYSKTKVAPLKIQSIPRLELCSAVLLTRCLRFVCNSMGLQKTPLFTWTDSSVVLAWLKSVPSRWVSFVAHRVSEIQTSLPTAEWKYVPTGSNPADCASRGVLPPSLHAHPLWWNGPQWLCHPASAWPLSKSDPHSDTVLEARKNVQTHHALPQCDWDLPDRVSSWPKLLRITAWVMRFVDRLRHVQRDPYPPYLLAAEIKVSSTFWCKHVQRKVFFRDTPKTESNSAEQLVKSIRSLSPFVDSNGLVRIGGRLTHSELCEEEKHPILLPKCRIAALIIRHVHISSFHGGIQVSLRLLRQQYWILRARSMIKACVFACVICTRQRAATVSQKMGDLPPSRVTRSRPFSHTGVDYAGPYQIRSSKGRGIKCHKAYCALFICLTVRAIHLEVVDDCTTAGFMAAFKRFASRRGLPSNMYSDNGTNFVGAARELTGNLRLLLRDPELQNQFASDGVEWRFIPPAAPQFGGLWEAGVKSVKFHLKRIMGNFTPTYEEFSTLLCNIEGILNSRPLSPLYDDPESFDVLTPGHFLVGSPLKAVPAPSVLNVNENRLTRWQTVQRLQETFWRIWSSDYLNSLQQRVKWQSSKKNLQVGDLVLLRNPQLPPAKWELGRIVHCFPGTDNLVRVVSVKTAKSIFKRPVTQLCKLPVDVPPEAEALRNSLHCSLSLLAL